MLAYELNSMGKDFLAAIRLIADSKSHAHQDHILTLLDAIRLRDNFHLALRMAAEEGMSDQSAFYCYEGEVNSYADDEYYTRGSTMTAPYRLFRGLEVEKSVRGAWQAYLLYVSETLLPVSRRGDYIRRTYFFDRANYQGITPMHAEEVVNIPLKKIPFPTVERQEKRAIVRCPYWSDWHGLVMDTCRIKYLDHGMVSVAHGTGKVLQSYDGKMAGGGKG